MSSRLQELEELQQRLQALEGHTALLRNQRDRCAVRALTEGATERTVAAAIGVAPSYVNALSKRIGPLLSSGR